MLIMSDLLNEDKWLSQCVRGMNSSQPEAMLQNEIEAHPETWNKHTVHFSMYTALLHACPESPYHEAIRKEYR